MKIIGRNDPCPCGSGKKYKKCCQLKDETANFEIFRYEKYLSIRASAAEKMMNIAQNKIGITLADVLSFLTYSPIFNERKIDLFSYHEDEAILIQFITNSILMYAYPVGNLSNNLLWKHCLNEYRNKFNEEEIKSITATLIN